MGSIFLLFVSFNSFIFTFWKISFLTWGVFFFSSFFLFDDVDSKDVVCPQEGQGGKRGEIFKRIEVKKMGGRGDENEKRSDEKVTFLSFLFFDNFFHLFFFSFLYSIPISLRGEREALKVCCGKWKKRTVLHLGIGEKDELPFLLFVNISTVPLVKINKKENACWATFFFFVNTICFSTYWFVAEFQKRVFDALKKHNAKKILRTKLGSSYYFWCRSQVFYRRAYNLWSALSAVLRRQAKVARQPFPELLICRWLVSFWKKKKKKKDLCLF